MDRKFGNKNTDKRENIDFVILWLDGDDPDWLEIKKAYDSSSGDDRPQRYRDWGLLKYWFRGVEQFAPWVHRIYFVTWGHLPDWLRTDHPKLVIVRHEDYLPEELRPTFNCNALEINLHRISGLSEQFVYFNDDFFLIDRVRPEDFFVDGLPRDMLALQPVVANPLNPVMSWHFLNNSLAISRHFKKRTQMRRLPGKFFYPRYPLKHLVYNCLETVFPQYTGFYTVHGPSPFLKSTFFEVWEKEREVLEDTTAQRFRSKDGVTQYLFREWQKQTGAFYPANLHRDFQYLDGSDSSSKNLKVITGQKKKMVCINDSDYPFDFEKNSLAYRAAMRQILPDPSSFEKL